MKITIFSPPYWVWVDIFLSFFPALFPANLINESPNPLSGGKRPRRCFSEVSGTAQLVVKTSKISLISYPPGMFFGEVMIQFHEIFLGDLKWLKPPTGKKNFVFSHRFPPYRSEEESEPLSEFHI